MNVFKLLPADEAEWCTLELPPRYQPDLSMEDSLEEQHSIASIWNPPKFVHAQPQLPICDFPESIGPAPIFSERACDVLGELLKPSAEFLPVDCPDATYLVVHITALVDCLDRKRSKVEWFPGDKPGPHPARHISHHEFRVDAIGPHAIFVFPENFNEPYVTGRFVDMVKATQLRGFRFEKVFPVSGQEKYGKWIAKRAKKKGTEK